MDQLRGLSWEEIAAFGGFLLAAVGLLWRVTHSQFKDLKDTIGRLFEKMDDLNTKMAAITERCHDRERDHIRYDRVLEEHTHKIMDHENRITSLEVESE